MTDTAATPPAPSEPLRTVEPPAALAAKAHVSGMAAYRALCAEAEADYEGYWARHARELPAVVHTAAFVGNAQQFGPQIVVQVGGDTLALVLHGLARA